MLLKPFRITTLPPPNPAGDSLGSLGSLVQLSTTQYDSTITSNPAATLTYLDDDDGEVMTVGSSFELQQRLAEPLPPGQKPPPVGVNEYGALHSFDVAPTVQNERIWKTFQLPSQARYAPESGSALITTRPSAAPRVPFSVTQDNPSATFEDAVISALQSLDSRVQSFAEFLLDASKVLRDVADQTRESSTVDSILGGFQGIFHELGKVGKSVVEAFDADPHTSIVELLHQQPPVPTPAVEVKGADSTQPQSSAVKDVLVQEQNPSPSTCSVSYNSGFRALEQMAPAVQSTFARQIQQSSLPSDRNLDDSAKLSRKAQLSNLDWCSHTGSLATTTSRSACQDGAADQGHQKDFQSLEENSQRISGISQRGRSAGLVMPQETAESIAATEPTLSAKSILDLEDLDSDFTARYPSLLSIEQSNITPLKYSRLPRETTNATSRPLPGSWPEPRMDVEGPALPTSEETSGAFFNRMARNQEQNVLRSGFDDINAWHPLLGCRDVSLGRHNTVTASNPAARLSSPFEPLEDLRHSRERNGLPRRSGTEKYSRRPYAEQYSGAGRLPWESFENLSQPQIRGPTAARSRPDPSARAQEPLSTASTVASTARVWGPFESQQVVQAIEQSEAVPETVVPRVTQNPSKADLCVQQLKAMGYGSRPGRYADLDDHRLQLYATVSDGKVEEAVEMLEEDKKAHKQFLSGSRERNDTSRATVRGAASTFDPILSRGQRRAF